MKPKTAGILLACLALAGLQYPLWFADDGLLGMLRARQELAEQEKENAALRERNRRLVAASPEPQGGRRGDRTAGALRAGHDRPRRKDLPPWIEEAAESEPRQADPSGGRANKAPPGASLLSNDDGYFAPRPACASGIGRCSALAEIHDRRLRRTTAAPAIRLTLFEPLRVTKLARTVCVLFGHPHRLRAYRYYGITAGGPRHGVFRHQPWAEPGR